MQTKDIISKLKKHGIKAVQSDSDDCGAETYGNPTMEDVLKALEGKYSLDELKYGVSGIFIPKK
jgi:hypothetical protein